MEPPKWRIMGIFAAQKLRERRQSAIFLSMFDNANNVSNREYNKNHIGTITHNGLIVTVSSLITQQKSTTHMDWFFLFLGKSLGMVDPLLYEDKHRHSWESHVWSEFSIPKNTGKQMDHHHFPRDISWYSQHSSIFHSEIILNPQYIYIYMDLYGVS